jgi:FtsP/CotA-like multicopper oxidase with cupredoxin domain
MCASRPVKLGFGVFLSFLVLAASTLSPLAAQNPVGDPPQFVWTYHPVTANNAAAYYSGVIEFGEANFVIGGDTFTTRAYRQAGGDYSIPGPTITMIPGNKYVLSYHNLLPYEPLNPEHNIFKDPNASNIHTHGLFISGESPGDDVTRTFEGGFGGDFVYEIPADHMGGTYWYHAHHHGATFLQVSGGAFGMLIIDDSADGIPANVAAMSEKQVVLGFVDPNVAGTGGDTLMSGTLSPTWTVNGAVGAELSAQLDTWQHWRVLVADRDARDKVLTFGPECEVVLLARDGVWRTSAPLALTNNDIRLTGASRADFAVRVSANSQLSLAGQVVANIVTEGTPDPSVHPYAADGVSMWSALRPSYLRDLRTEPPSNITSESILMGARDINHVSWDHIVPLFTHMADKVQEWSLAGATNHPFHLHIYHVQAQETSNDFEAGEFYDTISANMNVRFDLSATTGSAFAGRTIFHCHILAHEDLGAMGWMDVIGGTPPPTYPLDGDIAVPYSEYYSLSIPMTVVPASFDVTRGTYVSGDLNDLEQSDNSDLSATRNTSDIQSRVFVEVTGASPSQTPSEISFTLEASVFARSGVTQSIDLYNYQASQFEEVDSRPAMRFSDLVTEVVATGDLSRFVEVGTGTVKARARFQSAVARQQFSANIDQMIWTITE